MNVDYVSQMETLRIEELKKRDEHKHEMYVDGTYIPGLTEMGSEHIFQRQVLSAWSIRQHRGRH